MKEKKRTKEKKRCGQSEKISSIFRWASSLEKEINDAKNSHAVNVAAHVQSGFACA